MASVYNWPEDNELTPAQANVEAERRGMATPKLPQRSAGERIAQVLQSAGLALPPRTGAPATAVRLSPIARRVAIGAPVLVGVGTVLDQLNREGTPFQNIVGAGTGLAGNAAGGWAGALLGGLGGPLAPVTVPLGAAVGSYLGGEMASSLGRTLTGAVEPTPEEKQRRNAILDTMAAAEAKKQATQILAPTNQLLARKAIENELMRTQLQNAAAIERERWSALNQGLANQSSRIDAGTNAAIQALYTNGIM